jgi:hypothetical protein
MTDCIEPKKKRQPSDRPYYVSLLMICAAVIGLYIVREDALFGYFPLPYVVLHLIGFYPPFFVLVFALVVFIPTLYIQRRKSWLLKVLSVVFACLLYIGIVYGVLGYYDVMLQYIEEYEHISFNGYSYYALSITDFLSYEQYMVYRCDRTHLFCQRSLDLYKSRGRIVSSFSGWNEPLDDIKFFTTDDRLYVEIDSAFIDAEQILVAIVPTKEKS